VYVGAYDVGGDEFDGGARERGERAEASHQGVRVAVTLEDLQRAQHQPGRGLEVLDVRERWRGQRGTEARHRLGILAPRAGHRALGCRRVAAGEQPARPIELVGHLAPRAGLRSAGRPRERQCSAAVSRG
jgi:hypothetical protein